MRTTVIDHLPSSQTSAASGGLTSGVSAIQFIDGTLYGMEAGAGCSHGLLRTNNTILRVNPDGTRTNVADLSAFVKAHPVKNPDLGDFEPDGTWYGMVEVSDVLYATEPNHQELDRITRDGKITPDGSVTVAASGLTAVLGVAFDAQGRLYALETDTVAGFPGPSAAGTGTVVRVNNDGTLNTIASGLTFPTAMTIDPGGDDLYVSNNGFGVPAGLGQIVRIDL